ncbi:MAG: SPOR domain-containing protein [Sulfuritalea sp.]|nr:SPOR domain-containing protein [Sulfuritalea sp.]
MQLKKRARRRLVGAVALALFAVIVLPMVMDREPRPLSQDIQVRIPSQDSTGLAAKVLPGKPEATPMSAPEPVAEQKADPKAKPEPVAALPSAAPAVAKSAGPSVAKPAEKLAKPEKKIEAAEQPATDASGQWVVQLGAYKEVGNVKLLLAKLKGVGVPAYTEKFDSPQGPRTRVRAGPFAGQDAAEKARSRIRIIGVDGPVAPK